MVRPLSDAKERRAARTYPQHSFFRVADHVLACCPELCFVQLAREFSLVDLVLFGYEICGSFAIDRQRESLVARRALTTVQRLRAYAQAAGAMPGAAKARTASSLVLNGSRSPMESKVAFELSAPRHLGGFGLPAPVLNKPLSFTRPDGTIVRKGDLLWERHGVVIEYDSSERHEGEANIDRDARRRNEFIADAYRVLTVTKQQAHDLASMEHVARHLERLLGIRLRSRTSDLEGRRLKLHQSLYPKVDRAPRPAVARHDLPWQ